MSDDQSTDNVEGGPGETVSFPFDRMTVEQFRTRFPKARWSDTRKAWFVPGKTAALRVGRWLAELEAEADAFADAKGRDAFEFDPIESRYLALGKAGRHQRQKCNSDYPITHDPSPDSWLMLLSIQRHAMPNNLPWCIRSRTRVRRNNYNDTRVVW